MSIVIMILKALCWFITLWFGPLNFFKAIRGKSISGYNFAIASMAVTGLIVLYTLI